MESKNSSLVPLSFAPTVSEAPLHTLYNNGKNNDNFFIRNHFEIPDIDIADWKLTVTGEVPNPISFSYQDLTSLSAVTIQSTLECAGNSRATVNPPCEGLLWNNGGVGSAAWTGIPVDTILSMTGVNPNAKEVLFLGCDNGSENSESIEDYGMSIPLPKSRDKHTILAYKMNDDTLPNNHGYPLRLIVPGWYGMASVKWVKEIRVVNEPYKGFHQSKYYVFVKPGAADNAPLARVSTMKVKSLITSLRRGQALEIGEHIIQGIAWSGAGNVEKVEISTDNGRNWEIAALDPPLSRYSTQTWRYYWSATQSGCYLVSCRATDMQGNIQPIAFEWNFRGFANNSIHTLPIQIV